MPVVLFASMNGWGIHVFYMGRRYPYFMEFQCYPTQQEAKHPIDQIDFQLLWTNNLLLRSPQEIAAATIAAAGSATISVDAVTRPRRLFQPSVSTADCLYPFSPFSAQGLHLQSNSGKTGTLLNLF